MQQVESHSLSQVRGLSRTGGRALCLWAGPVQGPQTSTHKERSTAFFTHSLTEPVSPSPCCVSLSCLHRGRPHGIHRSPTQSGQPLGGCGLQCRSEGGILPGLLQTSVYTQFLPVRVSSSSPSKSLRGPSVLLPLLPGKTRLPYKL